MKRMTHDLVLRKVAHSSKFFPWFSDMFLEARLYIANEISEKIPLKDITIES